MSASKRSLLKNWLIFCYLIYDLPTSSIYQLVEMQNTRAHSILLNPNLHFHTSPGVLCAHLSLGSQGLVITELTWTEEYTEGWKELTLQYISVITRRDLWIYLQITNTIVEHENIIKERWQCWKILPVLSLNIQQLECYLFWNSLSFPQMGL